MRLRYASIGGGAGEACQRQQLGDEAPSRDGGAGPWAKGGGEKGGGRVLF